MTATRSCCSLQQKGKGFSPSAKPHQRKDQDLGLNLWNTLLSLKSPAEDHKQMMVKFLMANRITPQRAVTSRP